jgi:WD40 repeat protein
LSSRRTRSTVGGSNDQPGAPDGASIVTGGYDGRVALWDAGTGELLGSLLPGESDVGTQPVVLPDGHTVLIPAWDGTIHTWNIQTERWVAFACATAGRGLTRAEWAHALGDRPYRRTCP